MTRILGCHIGLPYGNPVEKRENFSVFFPLPEMSVRVFSVTPVLGIVFVPRVLKE